MEKFGISMLKQTKPILSDLGTYLTKVRGDVKKMIVLGGRDHKIEDTPPPFHRGGWGRPISFCQEFFSCNPILLLKNYLFFIYTL